MRKNTLLINACVLLVFCNIMITQSGFAVTERETHVPVIEQDRVSRYKTQKHIYTLQEEDLGAHTLTVRVKESLSDGTERVQDVRDIALQVNPEGSCDVPSLEVLYPSSEDVLFNTITQPSGNQAHSSINVSGSANFVRLENSSQLYQPLMYALSLSENSNLNFLLSSSSQDLFNAKILIFQDDGVLDESDYVQDIYLYDVDGTGVLDYTFLDAGDYLLALTIDFQANAANVIAGEYVCDEFVCQSQTDIPLSLNVSAAGNVITLDGGTVYNPFSEHFNPIAVKVSAPGGIKSVELLAGGRQEALSSKDTVIYYLDPTKIEHANFYRQIIFSNVPPSALEFLVTSNCDASNTVNAVISVQNYSSATVTLNENTNTVLSLVSGEQRHLALAISDASRSISTIYTVLYPSGTVPSGDDLRIESYKSAVAGELGGYNMLLNSGFSKPISLDQYNLQLPIFVSLDQASLGNYDLRVIAFDFAGQGSVSEALPVSILPPSVPPFLEVGLPNFRIPAGEDAPITVTVDHLGPLDRLEIQASGASSDTSVHTINLNDASTANVSHLIPALSSAQIGDLINVTVTAVDSNNLSSSELVQIEIGGWGERTITIDNTSTFESTNDDSLRYANIVLNRTFQPLIHDNPNIRFNRIEVGPSAELHIGSTFFNEQGVRETNALGVLELQDALVIQSGGTVSVAVVSSLNQGADIVDSGGSHGGDGASSGDRPAYGRIRQPRFPGASAGSNVQGVSDTLRKRSAGGGTLEIIAPNIEVNGTLSADGEQGTNYSFGFGGSHGGAGGSLLIRTQQLDGTGTISVVGGNPGSGTNTYRPGAGGRIAIYYTNYGNGSVALNEGLTLDTHSGSGAGTFADAGVGTTYLKSDAETYGQLIINPRLNFARSATTTLPAVGRHVITDVQGAGNNRYRVIVAGTPWRLPDGAIWEAGLVDLQVSLDANNPDAALYTIVDNNMNSFVVDSLDDLTSLIGNELIGVYRFDDLLVGTNVLLETGDRVYADNYTITDVNALLNVAEVRRDQVFNLGDYVQANADPIVYVGDVDATSIDLSNSNTQVFGRLTVTGALDVASSNVVVTEALSVNSIALANTSARLTAHSDLQVTQNISFVNGGSISILNDRGLSANSITFNNGSILMGDGVASLAGDLNMSDGVMQAGTINVQGLLDMSNNAELSATNDINIITGNATISGRVSAVNFNITGNLILSGGQGLIVSNIDIGGTANLNNGRISLTNNYTSGALDLSGNSNVTNNTQSGLSSVQGNLTIADNSTFQAASAVVDGFTTISGDSDITTQADFTTNGALDMVGVAAGGSNTATLNIGAQLEVGGDVDLASNARLIAADATILNTSNLLINTNSVINISNTLDVSGIFGAATGSQLNIRNTQANIIQLDGTTETIEYTGVAMQSNGTLALINTNISPFRDAGNITQAQLQLSALNGSLIIDQNTTINFNSYLRVNDHQGLYPLCSSGLIPQGGHGGVSVNVSVNDCAYGRYDIANLPGATNSVFSSIGAGVISLDAQSLTLNGQLLVDADPNRVASGGSINILADQLLGAGVLSANAGRFGAQAAGGGRILIRSNDISGFTGSYSSYGGGGAGATAGAGTVLLADRDLNNQHLILDNNGQTAGVNSTPIVSVGRYSIVSINPAGANRWEVAIAESPWVPSDTTNNPGLAGRYVSLDAANGAAPQYQIVSNTASTLIIDSNDALDSNIGNDLIGVHTFERLTVTGGAYADFGNDRVIVNDIANSNIDLTRITASGDSVLQ